MNDFIIDEEHVVNGGPHKYYIFNSECGNWVKIYDKDYTLLYNDHGRVNKYSVVTTIIDNANASYSIYCIDDADDNFDELVDIVLETLK